MFSKVTNNQGESLLTLELLVKTLAVIIDVDDISHRNSLVLYFYDISKYKSGSTKTIFGLSCDVWLIIEVDW